MTSGDLHLWCHFPFWEVRKYMELGPIHPISTPNPPPLSVGGMKPLGLAWPEPARTPTIQGTLGGAAGSARAPGLRGRWPEGRAEPPRAPALFVSRGGSAPRVNSGDACCVDFKWVWVKTKPPYEPQALVFGSICQGNPFWVRRFDPQPNPAMRRGAEIRLAFVCSGHFRRLDLACQMRDCYCRWGIHQ